MKKGQGLSLNVIIIAAIALLILVILIFFVGRSSSGIKDGTSCARAGGKCVLTGTCSNGNVADPEATCGDPTETCCRIVPRSIG